MIKIILSSALIAMSSFVTSAMAAQVYPSNGIFQEMAGTTRNKAITIDLINTTGYRDTVRVGMFGGEVIYATKVAGVTGDMLGYKHPFSRKLAAYGLINFDSSANGSDTVLGVAYSGGKRKFRYNVNAEILSPAGGGGGTTKIKGGAYYSLYSKSTGRVYIAGEVIMDNDAGTTNMYAALRFRPKKNVFVDVGVYKSVGGGNNNASTTTTGIPLFFRLTLKL